MDSLLGAGGFSRSAEHTQCNFETSGDGGAAVLAC